MPNGSHMDGHRIYDLTAVCLFKCIFNLGPRALGMLQAPRYLHPALIVLLPLIPDLHLEISLSCHSKVNI